MHFVLGGLVRKLGRPGRHVRKRLGSLARRGLLGWLVGWLAGWLVGCMAGWLVDKLVSWQVVWMLDALFL